MEPQLNIYWLFNFHLEIMGEEKICILGGWLRFCILIFYNGGNHHLHRSMEDSGQHKIWEYSTKEHMQQDYYQTSKCLLTFPLDFPSPRQEGKSTG